MKITLQNRFSTIAILLILTTSTLMAGIPAAIAQQAETKKTYPFINAIPNPVEVDQ